MKIEQQGVELHKRFNALRRACAALLENRSRPAPCEVRSRPAPSMQKTGVHQARHDRHQGIESSALLRDSPPTGRQKGWQTDLYDMRESVFSLSSCSLNIKRSGNDGTICRNFLGIPIAKPGKLRRTFRNQACIRGAASHRRAGKEQTERPDCSAMRVTASSLIEHPTFAISARGADLLAKLGAGTFPFCDQGNAFECREKGMSRTAQHFKGHIGMRSCAAAIDQSRLRCQIGFIDQGIDCKAGEKISPWFVIAFFGT
jgi:hypothetical protein